MPGSRIAHFDASAGAFMHLSSCSVYGDGVCKVDVDDEQASFFLEFVQPRLV